MDIIWNVSICVTALVVVVISRWLYRWSNPKCNGKLPPGSMGFPIIGETLDFFKSYGFNEASPFITKRMSRYGTIFRTNVFGSNTVVVTDPDVMVEVFRQENTAFIFSLPGAFGKVLGKDEAIINHGKTHKHFKQITLNFFGPDGLKKKLLGNIDRGTCEGLRSKASVGSFDIKEAAGNLIIKHLIPKLISTLGAEAAENLKNIFMAFNLDWYQSFFSLSSWKSLYRSCMASRDAMKVIKSVLSSRKETGEKHDDILNTIIEDVVLDDKYVIFQTYAIPIAAKDTTSVVMSMAVKYITKNPKVLLELKREHNAILQNRVDKKSEVSWEEYKNDMTFTNMVINESLRLVNLAPVMFRKTLRDVEIQGYTIPKGWMVFVATSLRHYDPAVYENPYEFNPWRWEGKQLVNFSKSFMVFGGGMRLCPGAEFARLQIAMFLHHLVINYDFSMAHDSEATRTPLVSFPNGIHMNISPIN
ncbi:PREDICTED: cytochrome P450 708A2-like [Camelina sativa]|uniref:Cytochrome P450 708A2-like n=1 Tax=Camelina sativa TaxID=90675 RepID=A0ABM0ZEH3_CAMSA|nr:PREDICTED: cytochrome P450 708A2-like [Camelina sativa]XP_010514625.1 PREDICTED: cytochrome P450 708A2-like [Camelina sativa]